MTATLLQVQLHQERIRMVLSNGLLRRISRRNSLAAWPSKPVVELTLEYYGPKNVPNAPPKFTVGEPSRF